MYSVYGEKPACLKQSLIVYISCINETVLRWSSSVGELLHFSDQTSDCPCFLVAVIVWPGQLCKLEEVSHRLDETLYGGELKFMIFHGHQNGLQNWSIDLHVGNCAIHIIGLFLLGLMVEGQDQVVVLPDALSDSRIVVPFNWEWSHGIWPNLHMTAASRRMPWGAGPAAPTTLNHWMSHGNCVLPHQPWIQNPLLRRTNGGWTSDWSMSGGATIDAKQRKDETSFFKSKCHIVMQKEHYIYNMKLAGWMQTQLQECWEIAKSNWRGPQIEISVLLGYILGHWMMFFHWMEFTELPVPPSVQTSQVYLKVLPAFSGFPSRMPITWHQWRSPSFVDNMCLVVLYIYCSCVWLQTSWQKQKQKDASCIYIDLYCLYFIMCCATGPYDIFFCCGSSGSDSWSWPHVRCHANAWHPLWAKAKKQVPVSQVPLCWFQWMRYNLCVIFRWHIIGAPWYPWYIHYISMKWYVVSFLYPWSIVYPRYINGRPACYASIILAIYGIYPIYGLK